MSVMPTILFVSHRKALCGVYEFGRNVADALQASRKLRFVFVECSSPNDLEQAVRAHAPEAIIYNHYPSTMPWLSSTVVGQYTVPHVGILHEVTQEAADEATNELFDFFVAPDPTLLLRNPIVFKTGRLLPHYENRVAAPAMPTIGSFGFGTPGKGFEALVARVQDEFDRAVVRLRIPFATFGDPDGANARAIAGRCKALLTKPGITLDCEHDFLDQKNVLDFLAGNSINAFFYEDKGGRGISSAVDLAMAVRRPIAITKSSMFRHVLSARPSITVADSSLRDILARGFAPLEPFAREWTPENLVWDYERIISRVLSATLDPARRAVGGNAKPRNTSSSPVRKLGETLVGDLQSVVAATTPLLRRVKQNVSALPGGQGVIDALQSHSAFKALRRHLGQKNGNGKTAHPSAATDWIPGKSFGPSSAQVFATGNIGPYKPIQQIAGLNRILDPGAFEVYRPAIDYLFAQMPEMMARKIARANIQQAFVLDTVVRMAGKFAAPRLLSVGSYEDTACEAVKMSGFSVDEVDPVINYDLTTFVSKPSTTLGAYDVVFSTSVIEHVVDDESFIRDIESLLTVGGVGVLTCDFNDKYRPGDPLPIEDRRFYTKHDLGVRLKNLLARSELIDTPNWECEAPDFSYGGCQYTFATFVFRRVR